MLEKQINQFDKDNFNNIVNQGNTIDMLGKDDKLRKQQMYRDILGQQIQFNKEMQGYGNMTNVEKALNREDLLAYKHYDNNQYALIPGVNNIKRTMDSNLHQPKNRNMSLNEQH